MQKPPERNPRTTSSAAAVDRGARHAVERLLSVVIFRTRARHGLASTAWGLAGSAMAIAAARLAGTTAPAAVVIGLVAAAVSWAAYASRTEGHRTRQAAAVLVESRHLGLRNLLVTAEELLPESRHVASYMRDRVFADAATRVAPVDPRRVVPLTAASVIGVLALCAVGAAFLVPRPDISQQAAPAIAGVAGSIRPSDAELFVEIRPPAYAGRPLVRLQNPATIEAMAGSQMQLRVAPMGADTIARIRMNGIDLAVRRDGNAAVAATDLTESGYVAIDGAGRERRLIPLSVAPDQAPNVRIVAPARDMRMDSASGSIAIEATAQDDLGLASMEIRYTRISGTGEQFEFHEGTLVASVERQTDRDWRARTRLSLPDMKLEPGDALVYRAVARDKRPGESGVGTSDTYFVEIAAPGDVALAGFDMPPDRERYVLSQQMIVLKIERLLAREKSISKAAVREADAAIAAEQRAVRANFLFLLGGGVEDEEQEAETSTDILEGRFENRARQEILAATRLMTRAEQALSAAATALALPPAREAAQALQRAFGHSRYLLRALPSRARIDPARRLTGDRSSAVDWLRGLDTADIDSATQAAQTALADLLRISGDLSTDHGADGRSKLTNTDTGEELGALAERVLRIEPSAADLLQSSRHILAAREALAKRDVAAVRAALNAAAGPVVARAQRDRLTARPPLPELDRLAGALASEGKR